MNDISTLLREDVSTTEPTQGLDAMVPLRLGRQRLRARRLATLGGAAAAVVLSGAVALPLALEDPGATPGPSGPADSRWAARVRAALEPSVGTFRSVSEREVGTEVTVGLGEKPSAWHFYTVTADSAGQLDDPAAYCRARMALGYVSCTVDHDADGHPVVVQELAVKMVGALPTSGAGHTWDLAFARVPTDHLGDVNPGERYFRREAVVVTDAGTLTVAEQLPARTPAAAASAYVAAPADLVAVATDPELAASH